MFSWKFGGRSRAQSEGSQPDLIIGIDFGTAETGVAYATPGIPETTLQVFGKWSGGDQANSGKVPTWVWYLGKSYVGSPLWGYHCKTKHQLQGEEEISPRNHRWFKPLLDPKLLKEKELRGEAPGTSEDIYAWTTGYLRGIYNELKNFFPQMTLFGSKSWEELKVEFVFSIPTTMESPAVITGFRNAIKEAGFGLEGKHHTVDISLTEASAAAIYTYSTCSGQSGMPGGQYTPESSFMVLDAGGGTTDFTILQVIKSKGGRLALKELQAVAGINVGSRDIDMAFEQLVKRHLCKGGESASVAQRCAKEMSESERFQTRKHVFGNECHVDYYPYLVPHKLSGSIAEFRLRVDDLRDIFDEQINKIIEKLESQLQLVSSSERIQTLILSGGLGSNRHLYQRLNTWLDNNRQRLPSIQNMVIQRSDDPQSCVAKGLVIDRLKYYDTCSSTIAAQFCRVSIGVICKRPLNSSHLRMPWQVRTNVSSHDGKTYVLDEIKWLIRKGDPISPNDPQVVNLSQQIRRAGASLPKGISWSERIVVSDRDPPPGNFAGGVHEACWVRIKLTEDEVKKYANLTKARKSWYALTSESRGRSYRINYELKLAVGLADVRVEVWHNGRKYISSDSIPVGMDDDIGEDEGGISVDYSGD